MKKVNYFNRDFISIREELVNFVKKYYPDTIQDFEDASVGSLLIEINAALGDILSYSLDNAYNEIHSEYAQQRASLLNIARTNNFKLPNRRGAVTLIDFTVIVPTRGSSFDLRYCPIIFRGAQVLGGGQQFETINDIDFSSPYSAAGLPNRTITPNTDSNGRVVSYAISKRELAIAGRTKYFKRIIQQTDVVPFFTIDLPDDDIISIDSIIELEGTSYSRLPTFEEQTNEQNQWYYVDSLAQNSVFVVDNTNFTGTANGILRGKQKPVTKRFTYEFSDLGFATIRFGGGTSSDLDLMSTYSSDTQLFLRYIQQQSNKYTTGEIPRANTTLFIKYRVGGGIQSNVGANVLRGIGDMQIVNLGNDPSIAQRVTSSLFVTNPIAAYGGRGQLSIEEIRNLIRYNNNAQNRAVTATDYYTAISKMDSKFGIPYKLAINNVANKVQISVLGLDSQGNLSTDSAAVIRDNIAEFLLTKKMINDYISVVNASILNLRVEVDAVVTANADRLQVANAIKQTITDFFDVENNEIGVGKYITQLETQINNLAGVNAIARFELFNVFGAPYSLNSLPEDVLDEDNKIALGTAKILQASTGSMFEIKFPDRDIRIRLATL